MQESIKSKISKENTKLKEKVHRLNNQNINLISKIKMLQSEPSKNIQILSHEQPSLSKSLGDVLLDQYRVYMDKKKVAEIVINTIMELKFLNVECNSYLTKNDQSQTRNKTTYFTRNYREEYLSGYLNPAHSPQLQQVTYDWWKRNP